MLIIKMSAIIMMIKINKIEQIIVMKNKKCLINHLGHILIEIKNHF